MNMYGKRASPKRVSWRARFIVVPIVIVVCTVALTFTIVLHNHMKDAAAHTREAPQPSAPSLMKAPAPDPSTVESLAQASVPAQTNTAGTNSSPPATSIPAAPEPTSDYVEKGQWLVSTYESEKSGGRRIAIAIEKPLQGTINLAETATFIDATLNDPRGWAGKGYSFTFVSSTAQADLVIYLATPHSVDHFCYPLQTGGYVSCQKASALYLNSERWKTAVPDYADNLLDYRRYVVSHETGHSLGFGHELCPADGAPAPVMMQQTYGLTSRENGRTCRQNPWVTVA